MDAVLEYGQIRERKYMKFWLAMGPKCIHEFVTLIGLKLKYHVLLHGLMYWYCRY